jgi:hypothetical protein
MTTPSPIYSNSIISIIIPRRPDAGTNRHQPKEQTK